MTDQPGDTPADRPADRPTERRAPRAGVRQGVRSARRVLAQAVWLLCSLAALFLALGALFIAFEANTDNALVTFVLDVADGVDLGAFDRDAGIKQWTGDNADTKNALFNWGLGALVWLVVGRLLDRLIRPSEPARTR